MSRKQGINSDISQVDKYWLLIKIKNKLITNIYY